MKIANRGGHTLTSPGASAILDELTEDRIITPKISTLLSEFNTMISNQPSEDTPYPAELTYGVNIANSNNVDFEFSIHLNKAYDTYAGALGVEVLLNLDNPSTVTIGNRILKNMELLGFKNRGLKDGKRFGEINSIKADSIIVEICFVEATSDVELYKKIGTDKIARAVANGIDLRVLLELPTPKPIVIIPVIETSPLVNYIGHVQNKGWLSSVSNGEICGTVGESLRLEALSVSYFGSGTLKSQAHIQNYGWTTERINGEILGTTGMGLRLEAVKFWLDGAKVNTHIEYRAHVENIGWMEWIRDGNISGTIGKGLRIEAIQIRITNI